MGTKKRVSPNLSLVQALRKEVGLNGLADMQSETVRHRPIPERLLRRLTEPDPLTDREREVIVLLASGYSRLEIAKELGIGLNTVRQHTKAIYLKLDAHNRVEAINNFIEWES